MTLSAFDIGMVKNYNEPKYLLHFQWNDGTEKIYRYALVETMSQSEINHRTKQKEDEVNLTQKEIWLKKYSHNNTCLLYTSPSPRDGLLSRMPSSA